jgi:predicted DNA-binding transcriptional regulator AlpA
MTSKLLDVKEVCEFLGVKPPRAYELARLWEKSNGTQGLPCIRLGGRQLRFSKKTIDRHLASLEGCDKQNREVKEDE